MSDILVENGAQEDGAEVAFVAEMAEGWDEDDIRKTLIANFCLIYPN